MKHAGRCLVAVVAIIALSTDMVMAFEYFERLTEGSSQRGFVTERVYADAKDEVVGVRFVHRNTGFTVDLFQIQSVPQGFFWVNSLSYTDMGEPHICEHLLLGKGKKGQYVASLEDMSLGRSTALTSQLYTSYSFSSMGGNEIFFDLFEAKLDALVHPDFSDEEIRREMFTIGVTVNTKDSLLALEEKGTIYTEMVSAYERYYYPLFEELETMMFGAEHPLVTATGGAPPAVRKATPADLWAFHAKNYQLNNMGVIVTIPNDIGPDDFLRRIDVILKRVDAAGDHPDIARHEVRLPEPKPTAPPGEIRLVGYPGSNAEEPGHVVFAWPARLELDPRDMLMMQTFLNCLAGGQTSNLYNKFINSETRIRDLGASGVWSSISQEIGNNIKIGISDIDVDIVSPREIDALATMIIDEIAAVWAYPPGSPELEDFNSRAGSYLQSREKGMRNYLNTPPGFGNRGGGGSGWYSHLKNLNRTPGFRKSLLQKEEMAYASEQLKKRENIWAPLIAKCKLTETRPYAVAVTANPSLLTEAVQQKQARLAAVTEELKKKYGVARANEAIARYKEEYDRNTAIIEAEGAKIPMPTFMETPPLSYDPTLDYRIDTLAGSIPLVSCTFASMTSATIGLSLGLKVIPEDKLVYIPILPQLVRQIGVIKDGQVIDFATMDQRLQNEVLRLNSSISANPYTGRVELTVRGAGSDLAESQRALEWMTAGLFHPYLDADNLPRIRDVVDQSISEFRNRMKGAEENWVSAPAVAYLFQKNPLMLSGYCFLTQDHLMHRLKWRLMDAGGDHIAIQCEVLFDALAETAAEKTKAELVAFASTFEESDPVGFEAGPFGGFARSFLEAPDASRTIVLEALTDLATIIPTVPDETAVEDWTYLVRQMKDDLLFRPERALADLKATLALISHRKNARMFVVSNAADREALMPGITALVSALASSGEPVPQAYSDRPIVLHRMGSRYADLGTPTYVGLVNTNTRNGVFLYSSPTANLSTMDENLLLDFLAVKLYGGGGAHSMFMKTWSAGLAYSNGLRSSEVSGRSYYYAERCPDLPETMRFVVDELKRAPRDPKLKEYAIAQTFDVNRGPNSYESRAEGMANDIADGITPDKVAGFRQRILSLRHMQNLYDILHDRMETVYGRVLIGYGQELTGCPEGNYFIIGPDAQFESLAKYIAASEQPEPIYRIYPRDYWIIR